MVSFVARIMLYFLFITNRSLGHLFFWIETNRNYRPHTKFGASNVFIPVCHSVHKGVCIQGVLYPAGLHPWGLHPGWSPSGTVCLHAGGLHRGGASVGVYIQGGLHPGDRLYPGGLHPWEGVSTSRRFCIQGAASRGSASRVFCIWEVCIQGVNE